MSDPQPEGEVSDPQPEGEVSDPQPETALTSLIGGNETAKDVSTAEELTAAIAGVNFDTVRLASDINIDTTQHHRSTQVHARHQRPVGIG